MGIETSKRIFDDSYLRDIIREMEEVAPRASVLDRRHFLKLTGLASGGLVLAFSLGRKAPKRRAPPARERSRPTPIFAFRRTAASSSIPRRPKSARASRPPSR